METQSTYSLDGWAQITCEATEAIMCAAEVGYLTVFTSITDPEGMYGTALNYTEWGIKSADEPLLRTYVWPDSDKPCEHWVNTKDNVAKWKERAEDNG